MAKIKATPAFTASAMQVDLITAAQIKKERQDWQSQAWHYFDSIGEIKYAIGAFIGGALQKIRIFPAIRLEEDDDPEPTDNARALELMNQLKGDSGGHGDLLKTIGINLMVAGECFLIGLDNTGLEDAEDSWNVYSIDEITIDGSGKVTLTDVKNARGEARVLTPSDFILRIWLKHPRKRQQADSPLRGVLAVCEQLLTFQAELKALSRSRVAGAGVYWLPSQMDFADKDGVVTQTAFAESLTENMMMPIENEGSAASVVPFVAVADADLIEKVRHDKFDRASDDKLDARIEGALRRLAQGLTVPPEIVLGIADVNHWNALYISEDAFKTGVEGLLMEIIWALTSGYLQPMLGEMGDTQETMIWYDASAVTRRPNTAENAIKGHELLLISDEAARRDLGFSEDDAPDEAEKADRVERAKSTRPEANGFPASLRTFSAPLRASAMPLGKQLAEIDQRLRERLWIASDMALRRAIEKVGSRVKAKLSSKKDKALSEVIKGVDILNIPAMLGPATVKSLGVDMDALGKDAFDEVEKKWFLWTQEAATQALGLVPGSPDRKSAEVQLDNLRVDGWAVLEKGLKEVAQRKLYDPNPDKPAQGEMTNGNLLPLGLIRQAVAVAGGGNQSVRRAALTKGLFTHGEGDAWTSLGIATGNFFRELFSDNGVKTTGYVWEYGLFARTRPFEPHEDLDGVFFENFDDDVLRNTGDWPDVSHYSPGDHQGCFPAGVLVSGGGVSGATLRHYEGEMVSLRLDSGQLLTGTPNHPVLTEDGWVPLGLLDKGSKVISGTLADRVSGLIPDDYQMPARIEDVASALRMKPGVIASSVPVAPMDFHGDGVGSEVAIVWADRHLRDGGDSSIEKPLRQQSFVGTDPVVGLGLSSNGSSGEGLVGVRDASFSGMGGSRIQMSSFGGPTGPDQELGLDIPTRLYPLGKQALIDRVAIHLEQGGQSFDGFPGLIESHEVVDVYRRSGFSGHVYNLQTDGGWYIANGIIVHNCSCDFVPSMNDE